MSLRLEDLYGFRTENGTHLIDESCTKIISFWDGEPACQVENIECKSENNLDLMLEQVLEMTNICDAQDILKVFNDSNLEVIFRSE